MHQSPDAMPRVGRNGNNTVPLELGGRNPYLFVVGCPRSGTTLLQRMLDSHPQLAVANDTHFIPRVLEKHVPQVVPEVIALFPERQGADLPLSAEIVRGTLQYHRFCRLGLDEKTVRAAAAGSRTYRQFVGALYTEHGRLHNKTLAGEKTPDYVRHLPLLHALFPWARTVHIVRDGRNVALSLLQWATAKKGPGRFELWQDEPIAVCALWWRWLVSCGRQAGGSLGRARYFEVRYEDLVSCPEHKLTEIAAFLELPYSSAMVAYHQGKARRGPGLSAKSAWLPPMAGLRDWQTQMAPRDLELFEALAGDLLSELGYPRAVSRVSPEVAAEAETCRTWWQERMERRRRIKSQPEHVARPAES